MGEPPARRDLLEVAGRFTPMLAEFRQRAASSLMMALRRIELLWGSRTGTPDGDELEVLVTLTEAYEREHFPIDQPDPSEAIKFRLEQTGKDFRALIGVIGQRTRVYQVMRGARPLSLNMIRNLHRTLQIPAEVLIQSARKSARRASGESGARIAPTQRWRRRSA